MDILTDPRAIERKSMKIINEEIDQLSCTAKEEKIVKRVVHATAEVELAHSVIIADKAVESGLEALKNGKNIVTDVNMLRAGINKRKAAAMGSEINCFISDEKIAQKAKKEGITRSMMCMREAVQDPDNQIFVIGNAPTALFELIRLVRDGAADPSLIIGTPVGFVGAAESKLELEKLEIPFITLRGRRGGSAVAASIVNALLYMER